MIRLLQEMDYSLATVLQSQDYFREPDNEFRGIISINMLYTRWADRVAGGHLSDFEPRQLVERYLLAGATVGYQDKNILNMDLLRL